MMNSHPNNRTSPHRGLCVLLAGYFIALAASAQAMPSNKWRLQFSGGANTDGVVPCSFTPRMDYQWSPKPDQENQENAVPKPW
jgi:hypothetical protein